MSKILFLSPSDITIDPRILREIAAARSVDFEVLAFGIEERDREGKGSKDNVIIFNLKIRILERLPNFLKFLLLTRFYYLPLIFFEVLFKMFPLAFKFRPKIIHCSDYFLLPIAVFFKFIFKAKLIYDIHELESETNGISSFFRFYVLLVEKLSWRYIDGTIHVSPSIKDWYELRFSPKKTVLIFNSPLARPIQKKTNYFREKFHIHNNQRIFLYLGNLGPGKFIDLLLNLFIKKSDSAALIFMGHGPLANKIKGYQNLYPNIFFHESVDHDKVTSIACSADFGLCLIEHISLSDAYCLPNKLFEYVLSDLPVIATDLNDIKQMVQRYKLGFVVSSAETKLQSELSSIIDSGKWSPKMFLDLYELSGEFQKLKLIKFLNEILSS